MIAFDSAVFGLRAALRRICGGIAGSVLAAFLMLSGVLIDGARAESVTAKLSATMDGGYARLVFTFSEETAADVQVSNGILIVAFERPVTFALDQIERRLAGYVQAARRDPDGTAARFSLARKLTVNVMEAGERLFIDLLPDGWAGLPPGLPQSVVDELAKRAREAEQRLQGTMPPAPAPVVSAAPPAPVQLRVSSAPTFARFAFEMERPIRVTPRRDGQELQLQFHAPVRVELGEARVRLPNGVVGLDVAFEEEQAIVKLVLAPGAGVRQFHEERAYLVDVTPPPIGSGMAEPTIERLAATAEASAEAERMQAAAEADAAAERAAAQPQRRLSDIEDDDPPPAPLDFTSHPSPSDGRLVPTFARQSGRYSISFDFGEPIAAAMFRRGDYLWLVFDSTREIDPAPLIADATRSVLEADFIRSDLGTALRLKLARGMLASAQRDNDRWNVTITGAVETPIRPVALRRVAGDDGEAAVFAPLEGTGQVHRIEDRDIGDVISVITTHPPVRGILRGQNFVEFHALASAHGLAIVPRADDLQVSLSADGVFVRRPGGLALSGVPDPPPPSPEVADRRTTPLDAELWEAERARPFEARQAELAAAIITMPEGHRAEARIMLARFYLAHGFAAEAIGVLETGVREGKDMESQSLYRLLRGIAELDLARAEDALRHFTHSDLEGMSEAVLLRGVAFAMLHQYGRARDSMHVGASGFAGLPEDFQRRVLFAHLRASVEARDFVEASRLMHDLELKGVPSDEAPAFMLLAGRVAEGIGRFERARLLYDEAEASGEGPAAAEARLRSIAMRHARGELDRPKAIDRLETLSAIWRGDRIELETLRLLGNLYVAEARYREAFQLLDAALQVDPESDVTHAFQTEMATVFEDLYLTGKSATLPPVEALALYYDYNTLTPIGRRGDELIRRLADRLVSVELFDQAAELLDHQVQYRLTGAARAQVAARLAEIHLLNREPEKAVRVLASTRMPALPQSLREQRFLLEARALSGAGRHAAALELIANLSGAEVDRLRADIAWGAENWREAGEQLETLLGERWRREEPLSPGERHDVLRASLAYAFADERIGLSRLKEKFLERLGEGPEAKVITLLVAQERVNADTLAQAASALSGYDSLESFLSLYRERYPDQGLPPDPVPTSGVGGRVSTR